MCGHRVGNQQSFEFKRGKGKGMVSICEYVDHGALKLSKHQDLIKWSKKQCIGEYTTQLGYATKMK
jgi:hypothetical protein